MPFIKIFLTDLEGSRVIAQAEPSKKMMGLSQRLLIEANLGAQAETKAAMISDLELVEDVKGGSRDAFCELVRRHQRGLLRITLRLVRDLELAEDIVQESLIKAFEKIHLYEARASFKSWLYQITLNTARNSFRTVRFESLENEKIDLAVNPVVEQKISHKDLEKILSEHIAKLPERQKTALLLRIYEDLSFKEIAEAMDCPYDTAKANFRHGLLKIRESLENHPLLKEWSEGTFDEITMNFYEEVET